LFYSGETVRLLHELPESELPQFTEGIVSGATAEGTVEVVFYKNGKPVNVSLPFNDVEPVVDRLLFRTAVFWAIQNASDNLIQLAINSLIGSGFAIRDGLNVARLNYDRKDRWWIWGEKVSDPTGALVVTKFPEWDGCVVAFSGSQRFNLEFRLRGRGDPVILLHEREAAYADQLKATEPAMSLVRVLMNMAKAIGARYGAFPVADPWLEDETWKSLLRPPFYSDLIMLPETELPEEIPGFRAITLRENRAVLTVLPMKAAPHETPIHRAEEELKRNRLRQLTVLGEKYYDQMYNSGRGANRCYSNAKDAFYDAIGLANELGMKEEAERLSKWLDHIKAVFRSQFT
jgi:hypothetical protein